VATAMLTSVIIVTAVASVMRSVSMPWAFG
jgi:hypothetical protein